MLTINKVAYFEFKINHVWIMRFPPVDPENFYPSVMFYEIKIMLPKIRYISQRNVLYIKQPLQSLFGPNMHKYVNFSRVLHIVIQD